MLYRLFLDFWWLGLFSIIGSLWASGHAILYKRDVRAAVGWVGFIWVAPLIGSIGYYFFGINRIQRRAGRRRRNRPRLSAPESDLRLEETAPEACIFKEMGALATLGRLADQVAERPLLRGNLIDPLYDGDQAYRAMCDAIDQAQYSVGMVTYIFDNDRAGLLFVEALRRAVQRGVQVRVLADDVGLRYSWKPIDVALHEAGVPVSRFMRTVLPWKMAFINLRNHRKLLLVDGKIGFTGGMNIREGHMPSLYPDAGIQDMHFRLQGPVVAHLQEVFAEDWAFTTGEILDGEAWFPALSPAGDLIARGIADGPDEDFEKLRTILLGALACAQSSVRIMTPYFLPDQPLITSLNIAALRGVKVEIMLPAHCNLKVVQWACRALLPQLLQRGCRVFFTPPPFDHSKLMVVDEAWALIGSANWDPRSLRLNFEFNVEIYNKAFARSLHEFLGQKLARSHEITREELQQRPLPHQLRDGIAHLFSPYM